VISGGVSRGTILDLVFSIGLLAMAVIAYRQRQHSLHISLGYLYLYAIALFCALALLLNLGGVVWSGSSLALQAYAEDEYEPDADEMQAFIATLPVVRRWAHAHVGGLFFYTRTELIQRLVGGVAGVVAMGGLLALHLWWGKRMGQRVGASPIAWGYLYALVVVGFLLFLSYAQDLLLTVSEGIGGYVEWEDELAVRYWVRDLIAYVLNGGVALVVWLFSWRKAWRAVVGTSAGTEEEHAG
jgi:hypothetical protein